MVGIDLVRTGQVFAHRRLFGRCRNEDRGMPDVARVIARGVTGVNPAHDAGLVRLVHAHKAAARQHLAAQPAQDSHDMEIDRAGPGKV